MRMGCNALNHAWHFPTCCSPIIWQEQDLFMYQLWYANTCCAANSAGTLPCKSAKQYHECTCLFACVRESGDLVCCALPNRKHQKHAATSQLFFEPKQLQNSARLTWCPRQFINRHEYNLLIKPEIARDIEVNRTHRTWSRIVPTPLWRSSINNGPERTLTRSSLTWVHD